MPTAQQGLHSTTQHVVGVDSDKDIVATRSTVHSELLSTVWTLSGCATVVILASALLLWIGIRSELHFPLATIARTLIVGTPIAFCVAVIDLWVGTRSVEATEQGLD